MERNRFQSRTYDVLDEVRQRLLVDHNDRKSGKPPSLQRDTVPAALRRLLY